MGYSRSLNAIERVKPLLDQLVSADKDISFPHENPHMLGYHLREAMTIAEKKKVSPYAELKKRWTIRNRGNRVVAELRGVENIVALQAAMSKMAIEDVSSLVEVIGSAITHKAHEMFFPDADMIREDVEKLYAWARKNEYYLVVSLDGITLTKDDPGEAAWTPEST